MVSLTDLDLCRSLCPKYTFYHHLAHLHFAPLDKLSGKANLSKLFLLLSGKRSTLKKKKKKKKKRTPLLKCERKIGKEFALS